MYVYVWIHIYELYWFSVLNIWESPTQQLRNKECRERMNSKKQLLSAALYPFGRRVRLSVRPILQLEGSSAVKRCWQLIEMQEFL